MKRSCASHSYSLSPYCSLYWGFNSVCFVLHIAGQSAICGRTNQTIDIVVSHSPTWQRCAPWGYHILCRYYSSGCHVFFILKMSTKPTGLFCPYVYLTGLCLLVFHPPRSKFPPPPCQSYQPTLPWWIQWGMPVIKHKQQRNYTITHCTFILRPHIFFSVHTELYNSHSLPSNL